MKNLLRPAVWFTPLLFCSIALAQRSAPPAGRPNIVIILADDMGFGREVRKGSRFGRGHVATLDNADLNSFVSVPPLRRKRPTN